ncbi:MAG: hypothetical protein VCE12_01420 [Candidatus Latescibacterota bacterium]
MSGLRVSHRHLAGVADFRQGAPRRGDTGRQSMQAVRVAMVTPVDGARHVDRDLGAARALFEETCTMCHELDEVEHYPFQTEEDIADLLERMVDNGLEVTAQGSKTIAWYLTQTYPW